MSAGGWWAQYRGDQYHNYITGVVILAAYTLNGSDLWNFHNWCRIGGYARHRPLIKSINFTGICLLLHQNICSGTQYPIIQNKLPCSYYLTPALLHTYRNMALSLSHSWRSLWLGAALLTIWGLYFEKSSHRSKSMMPSGDPGRLVLRMSQSSLSGPFFPIL